MAAPKLFTLQFICVFISFYKVILLTNVSEPLVRCCQGLEQEKMRVGDELSLTEQWKVSELLSRPTRLQMAATGKGAIKRKNFVSSTRTVSQSNTKYLLVIMMLAGDIQMNPGPNWKFPCGICSRPVRSNQRGICCDNCDGWNHVKCIGMNSQEYTSFTTNETLSWSCQECLFPFSDSFYDSLNGLNVNSCPSDIVPPNDTEPTPTNNKRAELGIGLKKFQGTDGLKIAHLNVGNGGLLYHLEELSRLCDKIKPDVLAITETWLTKDTMDNCVSIEGYDLVRRDKPGNFIGAQGVGIYVKEGLSATPRPDLEHPDLMITGVQLNFSNRKPIVVVVVYRHPKTPVSFFDKIEGVFASQDLAQSRTVITGDFNIDYENASENANVMRLNDIANAYGFQQTIKLPTRITEESETCIDLTFTNAPAFTSGVGIVSIADHLMNYIILGKSNIPHHHRFIYSRNFKKVNEQNLIEDLKKVPWHMIECFEDIEDSWHAWKCLFNNVVNEHAPLRKFRAPKKQKIPWYDAKIDDLKAVRDQYHRRATMGNLAEDWLMYRNTRNKVTALVREAKRQYYTDMIHENKGDSKATWKILKSLLPKCSSSGITSLEINGKLVTDFKDISNLFNKFFTNIGSKLAASISNVKIDPMDYVKKCFPSQRCVFKFKSVTEYEVLKLIKGLPNGKATGIDNYQVKLIKLSAPEISKSLTYLFNFSLSQGKFPSDWKLARISPIFKKGPKTDPGNYRPVSILPVISKFMERIVFNQFYTYLNENKLLRVEQSGFRKRHSCQSSLHRLHEQLYKELNEGKVVGLIALDLRKAFDTVNHRIMLKKMKYYGVSDIEHTWFKSYLENRFQVCSVFSNISEPERITCGVPQGSILGPLMFLLYVNDMPACFEKCHVNLYADDTAFYVADSNIRTVNTILQDELQLAYKWLCCNKLSLHTGKTNSIVICSWQKRQHLSTSELELNLNGDVIEQTSIFKYLGLTVDQDLKNMTVI